MNGRSGSISRHDKKSGLLEKVRQVPVRTACDDDILRVHPAAHLEKLRQFAAAGGGRIEADTMMSAQSETVARMACGTAVGDESGHCAGTS